MSENQFFVEHVKSTNNFTQIKLRGDFNLKIRPFAYIKSNDILEVTPSINNYEEIYKVFNDRATGELKKIKLFPAYEKKETIFLPPHKFQITFRERKDSEDWEKVKYLENFHYRGKGLNKIVGRRTVLLAEIKEFGIVGFGVLSASVAISSPRLKLLNTDFTELMKSGLINRIIRIPRIVIHPEFRGINLGALMARHLVYYAKDYWDINHYTPIMVEVMAAMTEYHNFFEKAGFIKVGYTTGYKGKAIIPRYGTGSFAPRNPSRYDFMENQTKKPYLVYPLHPDIKMKVEPYMNSASRQFFPKTPKLTKSLVFQDVSLEYKIRNGSTERTLIIKEAFGVDSEHAFSTVVDDFSIVIEPGDVVLITGASGSGKSTLLRLFTSKRSVLRKTVQWSGTFPRFSSSLVEVLNTESALSKSLIDQVKTDKNIKEAIGLLNSVGLTEAYLYIKRPNQISDGQRYRFAIARLCDSEKPIWIADEFVSTLSSEMAAIVAKGIRKLAYKFGATLIVAAPHINNFLGSLLPNKLIKLTWGSKAVIYSMKIMNLSQSEKEIALSILNNGSLSLNNLQAGLISMNGDFLKQNHFKIVSPKQLINTTIKLDKKESINACAIKTEEGIGEILYLK
jgi:ABC-type lipoprotein export system ATPase subunit/GNAT superfamily N-acetyltransferase